MLECTIGNENEKKKRKSDFTKKHCPKARGRDKCNIIIAEA